jgi:hypothetical protein
LTEIRWDQRRYAARVREESDREIIREKRRHVARLSGLLKEVTGLKPES